MPHFGFRSAGRWLSYRVGWLFGAGVTGLGAQLRYLNERSRIASRAEKSSWLFRSVTSCFLVAAEGWLCLRLMSVGIVQTIAAATISCAVLLILPKPTPR